MYTMLSLTLQIQIVQVFFFICVQVSERKHVLTLFTFWMQPYPIGGLVTMLSLRCENSTIIMDNRNAFQLVF